MADHEGRRTDAAEERRGVFDLVLERVPGGRIARAASAAGHRVDCVVLRKERLHAGPVRPVIAEGAVNEEQRRTLAIDVVADAGTRRAQEAGLSRPRPSPPGAGAGLVGSWRVSGHVGRQGRAVAARPVSLRRRLGSRRRPRSRRRADGRSRNSRRTRRGSAAASEAPHGRPRARRGHRGRAPSPRRARHG